MEIQPHRRQESVGDFACVMTQAVLATLAILAILAILVFDTPKGCVGVLVAQAICIDYMIDK